MGRRDGVHTVAAQFPSFLTSEIHGPKLTQVRPPITWAMDETANTFFMFCDASYKAVRLTPGWRIRGLQLQGPHWEWVACPRSGASTASFSVRLHAFKNPKRPDTVVHFTGLTLEGPAGATDWRDAFPNLNNPTPQTIPQAIPEPFEPTIPSPSPADLAAPDLPQNPGPLPEPSILAASPEQPE
jgi:hypothetical protein